MRKVIKNRLAVAAALILTAVLYIFPSTVYAADAVTAFGSNYYTGEAGGPRFPIGIYIRSDEAIGGYHLELRYDNTRLKYVSGADAEEDGLLTIEGAGNGAEVKILLYFEAISGGEAGIVFTDAKVYTADGNEAFHIMEYDYAPVTISGEDTAGVSFEDLLNEMENDDPQDEEEHDSEPEALEEDTVSADDPGGSEEDQGAEDKGSEDMEQVNGLNANVGYDSALSIYEQSKQQVAEDNRDGMWQKFLYIVIFAVSVIVLTFIVLRVRRRIKWNREILLADNAKNKKSFSFEFETIPEERTDYNWKRQIRKDIERHEKAADTLEFKNFLPSEQEIEYIDLGETDNIYRRKGEKGKNRRNNRQR